MLQTPSNVTRRETAIWSGAIGLAVGCLLLPGLGAFGIWDPWELTPADQARAWMAGEARTDTRPPLATWLVGTSFGALGVRDWAGRLPFALAGLLAVLAAFAVAGRGADRRAGLYSALVAATCPLLLFNARQMLGMAPAFALQGIIAVAAIEALGFRRQDATRPHALGWLTLVALGTVASTLASGVLQGPLPPLLAASAVFVMRGREHRGWALPGWVIAATSLALVLGVGLAIAADHAQYSLWLGGKPRGGEPPTFEIPLERIFHSFAPWSALLPFALGRMLVPATDGSPSSPSSSATSHHGGAVRMMLLLWVGLGYAALTLYVARYGSGTYVPLVALAAAVGLFLRDVERSGSPWRTTTVAALLLVGILIRDFSLYPGSPIAGLGIDAIPVPEVFDPRRAWTVVLAVFAGLTTVSLCAGPQTEKLDLRTPYRLVRDQWNRGPGFKAWVGLLGALVLAALLFGLVALVASTPLGLSTLAQRVGVRILVLVVAAPVAVAGAQTIAFGIQRLGKFRMAPVLIGGLAVGGYAVYGYLPALSAHFSPREVYDTFNSLADHEAVLAEYRVGGRAAAYYARGSVREVTDQRELIEFLTDGGRRWAAFPSDELPAVNRAFRKKTGRHLFVADARSANVVLATNQSVEGRSNENFVARFVRDRPPDNIEHPSRARFEQKIELLGYDLEAPHGDHVGAGESFKLTWYFRVLGSIPGAYKPFVHIDGQGHRINGDHEPVDGRYPIRLWDEGDVVIDQQELHVPAHYRTGPYTIFIGFFSGSHRLEVVEGSKDNANRVRAGTLHVR